MENLEKKPNKEEIFNNIFSSEQKNKKTKKRNRKKWQAEPTEFSELLRKARTKHIGFTQTLVSDNAKIPRNRLSQWETGAKLPSHDNLEKLIKYYESRRIIDFYTAKKLRLLHNKETVRKNLLNFKFMGYFKD